MRQLISGLVAAIAVMTAGTVPAMACGGGLFQTYASPCAQTYTTCNTGCGGWAHERLPDPVQQYYYVNQGPTYTGPGNWAPEPVYREGRYGYDGGRYAAPTPRYYDGAGFQGPATYGYRAHRSWRPHSYRYGYAPRHTFAPRYGYAPRYSLPPRGHYAPHRSLRYGMRMMGMPRHYGYGYRERALRRYY